MIEWNRGSGSCVNEGTVALESSTRDGDVEAPLRIKRESCRMLLATMVEVDVDLPR